jgi:hypothetical protein
MHSHREDEFSFASLPAKGAHAPSWRQMIRQSMPKEGSIAFSDRLLKPRFSMAHRVKPGVTRGRNVHREESSAVMRE